MLPDRATTQSNIAIDIVLTLVTCGIYGLFWQNRLFKAANMLVGEERFSFISWFLLTLVTCGFYNFYAQYQLGDALHQGLVKEGGLGNSNLSILGLVLSLFGLQIIAMAIEQNELNQLYV